MDAGLDDDSPRARLAVLLEHFSELEDDREAWRVLYPIEEVLLLVTCATIASCDDFDDIVAWGEHHLDFLRQFSDFHHGVPCARWLRDLVNRVDPILFGGCFKSWIAALWPDRHEFIAIDGKTSRRTHDHRKGLKALHTLSAYATTAQADLGAAQRAGEDQRDHRHPRCFSINSPRPSSSKVRWSRSTPWAAKSRSPTRSSPTRPIICWRSGATSPRSKPTSQDYFSTAPADELVAQNHRREGPWPHRDAHLHRLQGRRLDHLRAQLSGAAALHHHQDHRQGRHARTEHADRCELRYPHLHLVRARCDIERIANGVRGHWGVESMHWLLDVEFKDDLSRYRAGHGAKNMASSVASLSISCGQPQDQRQRQNSPQARRLEHRFSARGPPTSNDR